MFDASQDADVVGAFVKQWLRALPDRLVPAALYDTYVASTCVYVSACVYAPVCARDHARRHHRAAAKQALDEQRKLSAVVNADDDEPLAQPRHVTLALMPVLLVRRVQGVHV
jgi:hypothetical protein